MIFRILRNVISLLTGHVVSKLFSLVCVIFLARQLGVKGFGTYGTVMAYLTLFATFADGGMGTMAVRDVAQDYDRSEEYFSHILILRGLLTTGAYGLLLLLGGVLKPGEFSFLFIAGCGLMLFPEAPRKLCISLLSAYERMDLVAGLEVFSIIFRYIPFFVAILLGKSLQFAFLLLVVSWIGVSGVWLLITKRYCLKRWFLPIQVKKLRHILYESFPFGIIAVLSIIFFKSDIIMLSKIQGQTAVGFYEGAYKFIEASMFIPVSLVNVLLPVMARSFVRDKSSYQKVYVHATRILALGILPVVIGVSFLAKEIILLVYDTTYLPSAPALSLLIWTLFVIFLNAPVGNIIATSKLMHTFLPYAIGNTFLNIVLNLALIPRYSFLGASFTTVFTECTGFAIQLWFANRVLGSASEILRIISKLLVAGGITSAVFYVANTVLIFPLNLIVLVGIYLVSVFMLNVITAEDKQLCLELISLIKSRFFSGWKKSCEP